MSKKKFEDIFFDDLDDYINGKESLNGEDEEYRELLQLGKTLSNENFSKNSNKAEIQKITIENIKEYKGENNLKKSNKVIIRVASFALICILGISTIRTSFAQELVEKITNFISIGHVTVYEDPTMHNEGELIPVPEELRGKIFDKDGNPIEEFKVGSPETMYTVEGQEIARFESETLKIVTIAEAEIEDNNLVVKDTEKLNGYTRFKVILPKYLPEGYEFDRAEFFRDENGVVENSKYISLYFTNDELGEYIYMQQRHADEETAYATGGEKIEQLKINGADAIIYDNSLDWEDNGVIYMLNGRGIERDELIKTAESFK